MRAKLCKNLRRIARARTVGLPMRKLEAVRAGRHVRARNAQATTRGVYRALKRAIRQIKREGKLK